MGQAGHPCQMEKATTSLDRWRFTCMVLDNTGAYRDIFSGLSVAEF